MVQDCYDCPVVHSSVLLQNNGHLENNTPTSRLAKTFQTYLFLFITTYVNDVTSSISESKKISFLGVANSIV
jgi:hypothetical protein